MRVQVKIPLFLQHLTEGTEEANVNGNTVGECLFDLVKQFPQLKAKLFDKGGKLHDYIEIFVNKKTTYPNELNKSIEDGDEIDILNVICGG